MTTTSTVLVGAISGAIAGSATSGMLTYTVRGIRAGLDRVWQFIKTDHASLTGGPWPYRCPPEPTTEDLWVQVICAPSRALRVRHFDPARAITFVRASYPDRFTGRPSYTSTRDGVQFFLTPGPTPNGFTRVCSNGRLDLVVPITPDQAADGARRIVDVVDLLNPIADVARAASRSDYPAIFGARRTWRARRFDWVIGISVSSSSPTAGRVNSWDDLRFPGREPARQAERLYPFCPATGYAADELRGRREAQPLETMLRAVLVDLLEHNGYNNITGPVDDIIDQWRTRRPVQSAAARTE